MWEICIAEGIELYNNMFIYIVNVYTELHLIQMQHVQAERYWNYLYTSLMYLDTSVDTLTRYIH